jgi:hypothetical protein
MKSRYVEVFLFFVLVGLVVLVGATPPVWVGSTVDYMIDEDTSYYHNLSANITGFSGDVSFAIDTEQSINWTNASGSFDVSASVVADWLYIYDSSTGNLTINATTDSQTGFFVVPIQATNTTDDEFTGTNFEFQVNATNDAPNFTDLNSNLIYNFTQDILGTHTVNALDEEGHYPLVFNLTFLDNCTHAAFTGRVDGENCSIFNLTTGSSTSTVFNFSAIRNEVGIYWANFSVTDFNASCPHVYCDNSSYEVNKTSAVYVLRFDVFAVLDINVSNCTEAILMEDEQFNCTVNITTEGASDELNISSYAFFRNDVSNAYNVSWFYSNATNTTTDFVYSLPISVTPTKREVGNWTINLSVFDTEDGVGQINIYVNYTESSVALNSISNVTLYENGNLDVIGVDEDLLILDGSVKNESLTFASNTSWVSFVNDTTGSGNNYTTATFSVDYNYVLNNGSLGTGNYSIMINVTDVVGNTDNKTFNIEIFNETAPEWNSTLDDPVNLSLVEDVAFVYNVSVNVSDAEEDSVIFYYENVSGEFCSLNSSTFNSTSGIINFTPTDCDVGYHNVTIIASDSKKNSSHQFNFSVANVADAPSIYWLGGYNYTGQSDLDENFSFLIQESNVINFSLQINDYDFLIPSAQRAAYYNESLDIDVIVTNSTGGGEDLFNFSFVEFGSPYTRSASYNATFTPNISHIGNYTVFVNVTDFSGNFTNRTFYLNISASLDAPVLGTISNLSLTVYEYVNFSVNATDNEDDYNELNLSFSIESLNVSAPNLTIGNETGRVEFNMSSNESYAGSWGYNVTVNDSDGMTDIETFYVYVYGNASLVSPASESVFNLTENTVGVLNFTINHSVGDNLTYEFWIDSISCSYQNNSDCDYGELVLRETNSSFGNGSVFSWAFTPNFTDETYGNYKNLTVRVYPNTTELNSSQKLLVASNFSFKLNISHTNQNVSFTDGIPIQNQGPVTVGSTIDINLSSYFGDVDYFDEYVGQVVNFSLSTVSGLGYVVADSSFSDWVLTLSSLVAASETVQITAYEYNESGVSIGNVSSNEFNVTFIPPVVTTVPSGGGGSTKLKYFSLRIIVPKDVVISDENYIDVPFSLQNTGSIDLSGIDLSTQMLYGGQFSDDIKIELDSAFIPVLKVGESRDYSMRIFVDTHRTGKYKATIFANVTSPKLSDWGDFFIELKKINETGAESTLIFTEKLISENPECLELTELFNEAEAAFSSGDFAVALDLAREVADACEEAIASNEQIKYPVVGFVRDNFYYISFSTLMVFVLGFIFYVYKRVRFNKYRVNEL